MVGSSSFEAHVSQLSVGQWRRGTVSRLLGKVQSVQPGQVSRVQGSYQSVGDGGAINRPSPVRSSRAALAALGREDGGAKAEFEAPLQREGKSCRAKSRTCPRGHDRSCTSQSCELEAVLAALGNHSGPEVDSSFGVCQSCGVPSTHRRPSDAVPTVHRMVRRLEELEARDRLSRMREAATPRDSVTCCGARDMVSQLQAQ